MALPKMEVQIGADVSEAERGLSRVVNATNQLQQKMKMTIDASGRLRDRFGQTVRVTDRMEQSMKAAGVDVDLVADAMTDLRANTARTTSAMESFNKVADRMEDAANDNTQAIGRTTNALARQSAAHRQMTSVNRSFGRSVQNVSFQIGDFATQVGAGTSASIALGQQLPQLLGGFGVLGAAMGAIVAIGVPLVRVLSDSEASAEKIADMFGVLSPLAQGVADAFSAVGSAVVGAAEVVVNNIDRILITAGGLATLMATKWVAGFVAARIATMSVAGALAFLRGALLRTGIGALIVGAGELVYQFTRLVEGAGSFSKALKLMADAAGAAFGAVGATISQLWQTFISLAANGLSELAATIGASDLAESLGSIADEANVRWLQAKNRLIEYSETFKRVMGEISSLSSSVDHGRVDLGGLFGGGEGDDAEKSKTDKEQERLREQLQGRLEAIIESQRTEREQLYVHLAEKQAILEQALEQGLLTEKGYADLTAAIRKETADKIQQIEQQKNNAILNSTANTFGALQSMAQSFGKKGAALAKAFGLARALVSTFVGAAKALELPFPANLAAFAQVMATGMGAVASIRSVNTNGSTNQVGGGGRGGSTTTAAAAPQQPLSVFVQGIAPGDLISGGQLSSLFDKLVDEAGDRGIRPVFAQ